MVNYRTTYTPKDGRGYNPRQRWRRTVFPEMFTYRRAYKRAIVLKIYRIGWSLSTLFDARSGYKPLLPGRVTRKCHKKWKTK